MPEPPGPPGFVSSDPIRWRRAASAGSRISESEIFLPAGCV